ncbi:MAG: Glu/Leu/Phe/Val dehydrogenase [Candidatus Woesearchaeota archaeon]
MEDLNPFHCAQYFISQSAELMGLDRGITESLMHPQREISVKFPVPMDDGSTRVFQGFRVQHNNVRGPYKGGLRYHWNVNLDEIRALATWMTIKTACLDLPLGGGKGGVICDPRPHDGVPALSEGELERMTRAFTRMLAPNIGPDKDIPASDVYTTPQIMGWIVDEYAKSNGCVRGDILGVVTGKDLKDGGSLGRDTATARGGQFALRESIERGYIKIDDPKGARVVVQGFGNAGYFFAKLLHEEGYRIVGVSDSKGGIYNPDGMDPEEIMKCKKSKGSVAGFTQYNPNTKSIGNNKILEMPCDVLAPSALEEVITESNVDQISAKVVVELANGPTTPSADNRLYTKGVLVLPDVLANAGGVTVSCYEWQQNLARQSWSGPQIDGKLENAMRRNTRLVLEKAKKFCCVPRIGAYMLGMERIAEKMRY